MRECSPELDLSGLRFLTTEGFLAWDEEQEVRHELIDGMVWAMPGGTERHGRLIRRIMVAVDRYLGGGACEAFGSDFRALAPSGEILYPDVWVRCGRPRDEATEATDPVAVFEVLSPKTRIKDLVHKRRIYQTIPPMRHIGFVEPGRIEVEHMSRITDGPWRSERLTSLDDVLDLAAIGMKLTLRAVYERVIEG